MSPRDMDATAFTAILVRILTTVPGAYAITLVDSEGETVDYAHSRGEAFDIRVAAAHLQIAMHAVRKFRNLGVPRSLEIRAAGASFAAYALPDGYALALILDAHSPPPILTQELAACMRDLHSEAGWDELT